MTPVPAVRNGERTPNPYATALDVFDADGEPLVTIDQALDLAGIRPKASCVGWQRALLLPLPAADIADLEEAADPLDPTSYPKD